MAEAIAVICSDIHYSLPNLKLADAAMRMAITKANDLNVPLIVAGDLHDTKANLRGECVNAMIETLKLAKELPYILIGNHDKINEKSVEHSLNFLRPYAIIVGTPDFISGTTWVLFPYTSNNLQFKDWLSHGGDKFIVHQGITGSNSGEYIQDKSAITKEDVAGMRVISGHYHARQTIKLPDGGTWDYIGSPYTMNFGEANDLPKGFQILMDDGSLEFVPTNLRKHRVIEVDLAKGNLVQNPDFGDDLIWIKVTGTKEQLSNFKKPAITNCRFDLIPLDNSTKVLKNSTLSQSELLDSLIDSLTNTTDEAKIRLKQTWKDMV